MGDYWFRTQSIIRALRDSFEFEWFEEDAGWTAEFLLWILTLITFGIWLVVLL